MITTVGADGKPREMHMLHLDSVPMWLATIDENRVGCEVFVAPRGLWRLGDDSAYARELTVYSANKIDTAGKRLKARARGEAVDDDAYDEAWKILVWFRKEHQLRMVKAARKLRSIFKKTHPEWPPPVQRLKRTPSIAAKLARSNGPRLSTMCDIGGCRAVVPSLADVRWLESQCGKVFVIARTDDRSVHGDATGYRALHLHVTIDGHEIEIQVRTKLQQEWAATVERWDAHLGCDLKHNEGPEEIKIFLHKLSELYSHLDNGQNIGPDLIAGFEQSRMAAQKFEKGVGAK